VLENYLTAPISNAEKELFTYLEKVNSNCASVEQSDIQRLHQAGWTDEAIYDAINVCGLFNFYNRWIDANGVEAMSKQDHASSGKRLATRGYILSK
jgi:alkylhydroperoxidase family enzyme